MKKLVFPLLFVLFTTTLQAQSKVFREVGEDIATQFKPITQDNELVGYLAFTRLEKADADSFNYRVTIMDENLNDIGTVNFREENLELETVAFEQNVLCLGYIQTALSGTQKIRTMRGYKKVEDAAAASHLLIQFISLNGKVINSFYQEAALSTAAIPNRNPYATAVKVVNLLRYGMQIRNVPKVGFCLFFGDGFKQDLILFDMKGAVIRKLPVPELADRYYLHASATYVYLMEKKDVRVPEGGYKLCVYSPQDLGSVIDFDLRDSKDNWLKVLNFDNDPVTGDAFVAGCIISPAMEKQSGTAFDYSNGPYIGLFTIDLGGPGRDMKANCSYWDDGKFPGLSADGLFTDKEFYVKYATAAKDFNGNTIFAGTALSLVGSAKFKLSDGVFVRQEASGRIVLDNNVPCDDSKSFGPTGVLNDLDKKDFYKVVNQDTRSNYMIIDDADNIYVYNVNSKKVMRTIPHKDGSVKTDVYPGKEGHIVVAEYHRKEKYTRFSIEAP
ncbi:DUF6770 family protein [Puia sp. P3]|uniref:DUF6770 family protein n=1 Tax=Puia sp. P3 TaxID=3423952 RepID=UPI003D6740EA